MDVKTAFLHGNLDESLLIHIPEGNSPSLKGDVCLKLKKFLYGLKQSPGNWHLCNKRFFVDSGFWLSAADPCLFIRNDKDPCFVFLHVYDLVIGVKNIQNFQSEISLEFEMKDLDKLQYVLEMKVKRDREKRVLFLSKELYVGNVLACFGMQDCSSVATPQVPGSRLLPRMDTNAPAASTNYCHTIGILNYLVTFTRSDLAYSTSCMAQFLNDPRSDHEAAFKHVLCYLNGTWSWGISLEELGNNSEMITYCDSNWGSNFDSQSFSGSCLFFYGRMGWKTSKQDVVALSSTEAEYSAIQPVAGTKSIPKLLLCSLLELRRRAFRLLLSIT
ncbi:hypothetical protein O181_043252 [Austropuccinia psidii MF-1]|uniref:Reverse transcriptase Ty1/copia-type domain-containing protein n=1 Tax=Austropuccinia psidii MF-1 TaxID=1389203 RepID=A0A9Q3DPF8_9BASI|nr:hypothetical protein [Austropuccinia psidii MF-1]